jgi:hypothetical protein
MYIYANRSSRSPLVSGLTSDPTGGRDWATDMHCKSTRRTDSARAG